MRTDQPYKAFESKEPRATAYLQHGRVYKALGKGQHEFVGPLPREIDEDELMEKWCKGEINPLEIFALAKEEKASIEEKQAQKTAKATFDTVPISDAEEVANSVEDEEEEAEVSKPKGRGRGRK